MPFLYIHWGHSIHRNNKLVYTYSCYIKTSMSYRIRQPTEEISLTIAAPKSMRFPIEVLAKSVLSHDALLRNRPFYINNSTILSAAFPSHNSGTFPSFKFPFNTFKHATSALSKSKPINWFVPTSTVLGRSVDVLSVMH